MVRRLTEAVDRLVEKENPADEIARLKADLDSLGVQYHPRHGADKLRALLDEALQGQAA